MKGRRIIRTAVAFEAGHDGFWLARWLAAQGVEAHVIHASSVAVTREHRRAKTDRLTSDRSRPSRRSSACCGRKLGGRGQPLSFRWQM